MPTTWAPRRASHDDTYAVPQPSSIACLPRTFAGMTFSCDSATCQMPHTGSSRAQPRSAAAT